MVARTVTRLATIALAGLVASACGTRVEQRILHRSGCEVCHQPLDENSEPHGIADAHPAFPLECTDCHGGNAYVCDGKLDLTGEDPSCDGDWVYDQSRAHPSQAGAPKDLVGLTPEQLDEVDRDYLRFVNPGDLRVLQDSCGRCHTRESGVVKRSAHAHAAGELNVARFRAGSQPTPTPRFGTGPVVDPAPLGNEPCAAISVARFSPLAVQVGGDDPLTDPTVANVQDQYLAKECVGCHISDFGPNDAPGNYRSSGCSSCHMEYATDGLSQGTDPWVDKTTAPHPKTHAMVTIPPDATCVSCHHQGARIGLSYQGMRERQGEAHEDPGTDTLGKALYGFDRDHFITDEDPSNGFDETPPDVHFEAGMGCMDCHTKGELHGDGHIYADASCTVTTRCEDCHGTVREAANPSPSRKNLFRKDDGTLWLRTKLGGKELKVTQVIDSVTPGHPGFNELAASMKALVPKPGDPDDPDALTDWTHGDDLECTTCHSSWLPSCYGCHVDVDLDKSSPYQTTGLITPGLAAAHPGGFQLNDMVLMVNNRGKFSHSMPASRVMYSLSRGGEPVFENKPRARMVPPGRMSVGFGQRAVDPHTTRKRSQFMACDRCHTQGDLADPDNKVLLDLTHGYGTERFVETGCDPTNDDESCGPEDQRDYRLDAVHDLNHEAQVIVGHRYPSESRPLTADEINAMRAIVVPDDAPLSTEIPDAAATNPRWPAFKALE